MPDGTTLRSLIDRLGLGERACAAEVNGTLVRRDERGERVLASGDRIEIVTLVGGG